jgi:tetratricopeptide (TPR) repeat protein
MDTNLDDGNGIQQSSESPESMPIKKKQSALSDSYVQVVFGLGALVIIGALLTIIFALVNGVIDIGSGIPRTMNDFTEIRAIAGIGVEQNAEGFGKLALSQISNGKYTEAENTIREGRARDFEDEERNQYLEFATAYLAHTRGNTQEAIEGYERTMELLLSAYNTALESSMSPNWAKAYGLHPNYYESAYMLSLLFFEEGNYEKQLEMLNIVIEGRPTNADAFVDRGNVKLELGDKEGAIEDFNEALRFIPDDEMALEGLKRAEGNE